LLGSAACPSFSASGPLTQPSSSSQGVVRQNATSLSRPRIADLETLLEAARASGSSFGGGPSLCLDRHAGHHVPSASAAGHEIVIRRQKTSDSLLGRLVRNFSPRACAAASRNQFPRSVVSGLNQSVRPRVRSTTCQRCPQHGPQEPVHFNVAEGPCFPSGRTGSITAVARSA